MLGSDPLGKNIAETNAKNTSFGSAIADRRGEFCRLGREINKGLKLEPSTLNHSKYFAEIRLYLLVGQSFMTKEFTIQNIYSKLYATLCANIINITKP